MQHIQLGRHQLCLQNDWIHRVIDVAEQPNTSLFSLRPNGRQGADFWVPTFCGGHVHLVRPDGQHPDAMLHVNPAAPVPAVLTVFNPSKQAARPP